MGMAPFEFGAQTVLPNILDVHPYKTKKEETTLPPRGLALPLTTVAKATPPLVRWGWRIWAKKYQTRNKGCGKVERNSPEAKTRKKKKEKENGCNGKPIAPAPAGR